MSDTTESKVNGTEDESGKEAETATPRSAAPPPATPPSPPRPSVVPRPESKAPPAPVAAAPAGVAAAGEAAKEAEPAAPEDPLASARADTARFKDQWMRTAADFDNFRKRSRRELDEARRGGRDEFLKELLPVFDNLERAVQSSQRATDVKGVVDGLTMVLKQFTDTLGRMGITKVPTVGSSFDPQQHEAIQQLETEEHPPGTIVAEVQPGYVNGERLVRAAMVVVAKPKAPDAN